MKASAHEIEAPREPGREPGREARDGKRGRILRAAHDVCVARGIDAVRMDEIAAGARVSKGTLYRFFSSKEELLLASVIEAHEAGEARVDALLSPVGDLALELEEVFRALVEVFPSIARDMVFLYQAAVIVARDPSARERLEAALRRIYAARSSRFVAILGAGRRTGEFRKDFDADTFASAVLAIFDGFLHRTLFAPIQRVQDELALSFEGMARSIRRGDAA